MADQVCPRCGTVVVGATDLVSVAIHDHKETPGKCVLPESYDDRVCAAFRIACANNAADGGTASASPGEVLIELKKHGWLGELDSVIDVADTMRDLRERGRL